MWRLGLRNASAHLGRLLLTAVAVVLGVTFVAGSLVLTHTSQRVLDQQFRTAASGADLASAAPSPSTPRWGSRSPATRSRPR